MTNKEPSLTFDAKSIRTWWRLGSCGAYGLTLCHIAENDPSLMALTADVRTYSGLDRFGQAFPDRIVNLGIAEQNMLGVAAGLAKEGFNPFASTYGVFAVARCLDQIRVSMGYMELPIKLVGVTSGLAPAILGPTHMGLEDIASIRSIPNVVMLSPADTTETVKATIAAAKLQQPVYLRLTGAMGAPLVYDADYDFEVGKAITVHDDVAPDVLIIATGTMVARCIGAAEWLAQRSISCRVVDMHTLVPFDKESLADAGEFQLVVSAEEHSITGGLGSAIAECVADNGVNTPLLRLGISGSYPAAASYETLLQKLRLDSEGIALRIQNTLEKGR